MTISRDLINRAVDILREVAQKYPRAYRNAHGNHNTHPERLDYIILATRELWSSYDGPNGEKFGMNGKRGYTNDPSADAIAYGIGRDVIIADVIVSAGEHGNDINKIQWNDVTKISKPMGGALIDPFLWTTEIDYEGGTTPTPTPVPVPIPEPKRWKIDRGEVMEEMFNLHDLYKHGLKRSEGLWIDGHPDFEGIAAWILDVYINARLEGKSREEARMIYEEQIRKSQEWRFKNS